MFRKSMLNDNVCYLIKRYSTYFFRHWLFAREDKIIVKGKGMMQTYWCEPTIDSFIEDTSERPSMQADSFSV
jgi:hypothetical protein